MTIKRRSLILGAGAAAIASPFAASFAQKAKFNYKYAHNLPITHPPVSYTHLTLPTIYSV